MVKSGVLDGLILTATRMADPLLARMAVGEIPLVIVGRPDVDGVSYVDADNRGGASTKRQLHFRYDRNAPLLCSDNKVGF